MQNNVGGVMAPWIQAKQLDIQQMGYPSQRMPVLRLSAAPCPFQAFPSQPLGYMRILGDVNRVIQADEPVLETGQESAQDEEEQQDWQQGRWYFGFGLLAVSGHHSLYA